ncbi:MAG: hypothetical protein KDA63_03965, partial [Planctomycetales bacterium]|nr:hypothetical protein [Planctomycetales bacterium]
MPANEKTWRDMKSMHVVFAIAALATLVMTIWMLAVDHRREWKQVQREYRDIEARTLRFRMDEQRTEQFAETERELEGTLLAAQGEAVSPELAADFKSEVSRRAEELGGETPEFAPLDALVSQMVDAEEAEARAKARRSYFELVQEYVDEANRVATNTAAELKSMSSNLDAVRSRRNIAVGAQSESSDEWQGKVDVLHSNVVTLMVASQQADTYYANLERIVKEMKASEAAAQKNLADHRGQITQLEDSLAAVRAGRPQFLDNLPLPDWFGRVLERPIIEGFGSPIRIDQVWLPDLTINYNFSNVARFDRCITCHKAIKQTAPGSADEPGYEHAHPITVELPTPGERPVVVVNEQVDVAAGTVEQDETVAEADDVMGEGADVSAEEVAEAEPATLDLNDEKLVSQLLKDAYGLRLADPSTTNGKAMVSVVWNGSVAARAGLQINDVIVAIGDVATPDRRRAVTYLLDSVEWGEPLTLTVERGFPHPFSSHPRLDLYVGDGSPHKMQQFGCTICHDGQGSATTFKFASHTPNSVAERQDWQEEYGWFDNHHWIFPMFPERFVESGCLKCHHEVVDLEPSDEFPEPPAPKLLEGFNLVKRLGCYGCHEINGYDGSRSIGPDLRTEPTFARVAQDLLIDEGLTDDERRLAEELAAHPENHNLRHRLAELISIDANNATDEE